MAKFIPILGNLHGSIAGTTFSFNRFGAYIRNRTTPVNPQTNKQKFARSRFGQWSSNWRLLNGGNQTSWKEVAGGVAAEMGYGFAPSITGQNLFVGFNSDASRRGTANATTAPPLDAPDVVESITLVADTAPTDSFLVTAVVSTGNTSGTISVYATAPFSNGISFVAPSKYRYLGEVIIDDLQTGQEMIVEYEDAFGEIGPLNVGQKIAVKLVPFSQNGYRGVDVTAVTNVL